MLYLKPLIGRKIAPTPLPEANGLDVFKMLGRIPSLVGVGAEAAPEMSNDGPSNSPAPERNMDRNRSNEMAAPALRPPGM